MALSNHVVSRWLERVRGLSPPKIVGNMRANGWHGAIGEADTLWWLEHKLGLDMATVHAEIEAEIASCRVAGTTARGSMQLATARAEFIAAQCGSKVEIRTVLAPKPRRALTH